jgi:hypothetical protein
MIDHLGGWALKSIGQGYGDEYDLELLVKRLGAVERSPHYALLLNAEPLISHIDNNISHPHSHPKTFFAIPHSTAPPWPPLVP